VVLVYTQACSTLCPQHLRPQPASPDMDTEKNQSHLLDQLPECLSQNRSHMSSCMTPGQHPASQPRGVTVVRESVPSPGSVARMFVPKSLSYELLYDTRPTPSLLQALLQAEPPHVWFPSFGTYS